LGICDLDINLRQLIHLDMDKRHNNINFADFHMSLNLFKSILITSNVGSIGHACHKLYSSTIFTSAQICIRIHN
jgi:hypothetical protein